MTVNGQVEETGVVLVLAGLVPSTTKIGARNAVEFHVIGGVVEHAGENTIVLKNKLHDITGAPVIDQNGETVLERGNALRGKVAVVIYRNGQVISVKIFFAKQDKESGLLQAGYRQ